MRQRLTQPFLEVRDLIGAQDDLRPNSLHRRFLLLRGDDRDHAGAERARILDARRTDAAAAAPEIMIHSPGLRSARMLIAATTVAMVVLQAAASSNDISSGILVQ